MSAPMGGTYQVVCASELRRRRLASARSIAGHALALLAAVERDARARRRRHGDAVTPVEFPGLTDLEWETQAEDSDAVERAAADLEALATAAVARLRAETVAAREQQIAEAIQTSLSAPPPERGAPPSAAARAAQRRLDARPQAWFATGRGDLETLRAVEVPGDRAATVAGCLGLVTAPELADDEFDRLVRHGQDVLEAPDDQRAQRQLMLLYADVVAALRQIRHPRPASDAVPRSTGAIGEDGSRVAPSAEVVDYAARDAAADPTLGEVVSPAAAAVRADRDFVAAAVATALREVGYDVDEELANWLASSEKAHLHRQDQPGHTLRVDLEPEARRLFFQLLDDDADRGLRPDPDQVAEAGWQRTFDEIVASLARQGVALAVPGAGH